MAGTKSHGVQPKTHSAPSTRLSEWLLSRAPASPSPPSSADRQARAPCQVRWPPLPPRASTQGPGERGHGSNRSSSSRPHSGLDLRAVAKALVALKVREVSLLRSRGIACRLGGCHGILTATHTDAPPLPTPRPFPRHASSHATPLPTPRPRAPLHFQTCATSGRGPALPRFCHLVTFSKRLVSWYSDGIPFFSFFFFCPLPGIVSQLSKGLCSKYESTAMTPQTTRFLLKIIFQTN